MFFVNFSIAKCRFDVQKKRDQVARIGGWGGGVLLIRAMPESKRFFQRIPSLREPSRFHHVPLQPEDDFITGLPMPIRTLLQLNTFLSVSMLMANYIKAQLTQSMPSANKQKRVEHKWRSDNATVTSQSKCKIPSQLKGKLGEFFLLAQSFHWPQTKTSLKRQFSPKIPEEGKKSGQTVKNSQNKNQTANSGQQLL